MDEAQDRGNLPSVDIFIFSNGEHQTPPRKYHLTADTLNRWEELKRSLGQLHYGNTNTIDLYTIDGQILADPLHVMNGGTYVAVLITETFVPAGYYEYLMRASRSREKRENLKNACDGASKIGHPYNLFVGKEIPNIKTLKQNTDNTKTGSSESRPQLSEKTTLPPQRFEKRISYNNSSLSQKRPIASNALTKTINKNKNLRQNMNKIPAKSARENINTYTKHQKAICCDQYQLQSSAEQALSIETIEVVLEPKNKSVTSKENNLTTDATKVENDDDGNDLIIVKNADSSLYKSLSSAVRQPRISHKVIAEERKSSVVFPTIDNAKNNKNETIIVNLPLRKPSEINIDTKCTSSRNELNTKSYAASVKKGETIQLNLKIEIKQDNGVDVRCNKSQHITENCSQIDMNEIIFLPVKKHSDISNKLFMKSEDEKFFALRCCNCHYHGERNKNITQDFKDAPYFSFLPFHLHENNIERQCNTLELSKDNTEAADHRKKINSAENTIRKLNATTSILAIEKKIRTSSPAIGVTTSKSLLNTNAMTVLDVVQKPNTNQKDVTRIAVISNTNVISHGGMTTYSSQKEDAGPKPLVTTKTVSNSASTQTEWCSLLIEARRQHDDRYTFYLPPLNVLKQHSLL